MKIGEFKNLISELPFKQQSFDINKSSWECINQTESINRIFDGSEKITISRNDLFDFPENFDEFVIKTLMWGYPTKGRGNNIDNLLKPDTFNLLIETLKEYKNADISLKKFKQDLTNIDSLGLSTMTKFTTFLNTKIEGSYSIILDLRIIDVINLRKFEELNELTGIKYYNAINYYYSFLNIVNQLAVELKVDPNQIELFLFTFGKTLSPRKVEE